jgi:hypothetical protein
VIETGLRVEITEGDNVVEGVKLLNAILLDTALNSNKLLVDDISAQRRENSPLSIASVMELVMWMYAEKEVLLVTG